MTLEAIVFQQHPITHASKNWSYGYSGLEENHKASSDQSEPFINNYNANNQGLKSETSSSPQLCCNNGFLAGQIDSPPSAMTSRRKRRRIRSSSKNKEEIDHQRLTHIAVERNRRRQMNDYLSVLRSLMPPSYVPRGDQASIVGGAINFVKELEQRLQSLEAHKLTTKHDQQYSMSNTTSIFSDFFTRPRYPTNSSSADIEATMVDSYANLRVLTRKQPNQLIKIATGLQSLHLTILHLNITTTVDHMVLYSISVKVEEECQLSSVNEIATAMHDLVGLIQEEATFSLESS